MCHITPWTAPYCHGCLVCVFQRGGKPCIYEFIGHARAFAEVIGDNADPGRNHVGFVSACVAEEEGEIISIGVVPGCWGRGFGAKLVCAAEARYKKMGALELFLEVAETNNSAVSLYQSHGFKTMGRRKGYYGHRTIFGTDALIMRLCLA